MNRPFLIFQVYIALFLAGFIRISSNVFLIPSEIHFLSSQCETIPELNQKIIELVRQQIGKTVGRGECWDLAALVLNQNGAKWDGRFTFGRKVDSKNECIFPGDIIQFEGVKIRYTKGRTVYTVTMDHHTAVIQEVKAKGIFVLAHQNTGNSGRKVGLSDLDLKTIIKGKYQIYRPAR